MDLTATTNNFNYQEMLSAIDKISRQFSTKKVKKIKVSFDFYKKIKDNLYIVNNSKEMYDGFWGVPLEIDIDLKRDYEFIYEERDKNEDLCTRSM